MLKLDKLPDRTPVKISIVVMPDLAQTLADYAAIYARTYGEKAEVPDLIPAMLESFLASDRAFATARKEQAGEGSAQSVIGLFKPSKGNGRAAGREEGSG